MTQDEIYMSRAVELAKKGMGYTSPNPMVGAVIVKDGKIISEDYHHKYGEFHAERNAILNCSDKEALKGSTIYVTLEPCCHYGKTPPCTDIIIESGIKKAVIGSFDDNPLVNHKGTDILKTHGIEVKTGVLEKECRRLNEVFFHYIKTKTPFVAMKYAVSADGKIAAYTGHSKYITGTESRNHVHSLRHIYSSIMVGIGTVLADNPMLNCRNGGKNPIRIICDTNLKIPTDCNIVNTAHEIRTIIASGENVSNEKYNILSEKGVEILKLPIKDGHINLGKLMELLGSMGIDSILLEGGGTLNYSAVENGIVNKVYEYIAPKIIGGKTAKTPVEGKGFSQVDNCMMLETESINRFGNDVLITYNVKEKPRCLQE